MNPFAFMGIVWLMLHLLVTTTREKTNDKLIGYGVALWMFLAVIALVRLSP